MSPADHDDGTAGWRDDGRRRWTPRVQFVRTSKSVLLMSVFVAVLLNQLLWTAVGKGVHLLNSLKSEFSTYFIEKATLRVDDEPTANTVERNVKVPRANLTFVLQCHG